MARIFFLGIVIYLVYKLVFDLIIPVILTAGRMKKQFGNMHQSFTGNHPGQEPSQNSKSSKATSKSAGDYIDFEEVKS
jgi:hypothetical protein